MEVIVSITGEGNVDVKNNGYNATLTAIPLDGFVFGYWCFHKGDLHEKRYGNPYTLSSVPPQFLDEKGNLNVEAYFYMNMYDYLMADFSQFDIERKTLAKIASKRGYRLSDDSDNVSDKQKELSEADILMVVCNSYSTVQGGSYKVGNMSKTNDSKTLSVTDKQILTSRANTIYAKWGEKPKTGVTARIGRYL